MTTSRLTTRGLTHTLVRNGPHHSKPTRMRQRHSLIRRTQQSESASQKSCPVTNRSLGDCFFRGILSSARFTSSGKVSSERARTHKSCTSSRPGARFCVRARFCPDTVSVRGRLMGGALRQQHLAKVKDAWLLTR